MQAWLCLPWRKRSASTISPPSPRRSVAGEAESGVGLEGESFRWLNFRPGNGAGDWAEIMKKPLIFVIYLFICSCWFTWGAAHFYTHVVMPRELWSGRRCLRCFWFFWRKKKNLMNILLEKVLWLTVEASLWLSLAWNSNCLLNNQAKVQVWRNPVRELKILLYIKNNKNNLQLKFTLSSSLSICH